MLKKCPICELNYLRGTETICRVCAAARSKRHAYDAEQETVMCSECGEKPAVPGHDLANLEVLADKIRADEAEDPLEEDLEDAEDEE